MVAIFTSRLKVLSTLVYFKPKEVMHHREQPAEVDQVARYSYQLIIIRYLTFQMDTLTSLVALQVLIKLMIHRIC